MFVSLFEEVLGVLFTSVCRVRASCFFSLFCSSPVLFVGWVRMLSTWSNHPYKILNSSFDIDQLPQDGYPPAYLVTYLLVRLLHDTAIAD